MGLSRKSFPERFNRRGKAYLECREYHSAGRGGSQTGYKAERELSTSVPSASWLQTQPASPAAPCRSLALPTVPLHTHTVNQIDPPPHPPPPPLTLFLVVLWLQHRRRGDLRTGCTEGAHRVYRHLRLTATSAWESMDE